MAEKKIDAEVEKKIDAEAEKMVSVYIPRERNENEEDKVVWVNSRRFVIKKGQHVDVPECVAEVLRHEEAMLDKQYEYVSNHKK